MASEIEFVTAPSATLVKHNASDDDVALAAWVSFARDETERLEDRKAVGGLINFLMREKHMSPFEHSTFTFKIDCPIFVAREFHRHRTMAYNEVSGRYTEMKPRFYVPDNNRPLIQYGKAGAYTFGPGTEVQYKEMRAAQEANINQAWGYYQFQLENGVAKEVARMQLPLSLMTQFYATVNARNLMHFLGLRSSPQALYEIRQVAGDMKVIFKEVMPLTYEAWKRHNPTAPGQPVSSFNQLKTPGGLVKEEL